MILDEIVAIITSVVMGVMAGLPVAEPVINTQPPEMQAVVQQPLSELEYMNIDISTPADGYEAASNQKLTMYFQYSGIYDFPGELSYGVYITSSMHDFESSLQPENVERQFTLVIDSANDSGTMCEGSATCDLTGLEPGGYTLWAFCYKGTPDRVEELTFAGNNITIFPARQTDESGWFEQDDELYYARDGLLCYGWQPISGHWYYFDSTGAMVVGWNKDAKEWYYMDMDGVLLTGWQNIGTERYFFDPDGGEMARGWMQQNDSLFYFKDTGEMVTGWQDITADGATRRYYFEVTGHMATGWRRIDGNEYYFGSGGAMVSGARAIDGKTYVFGTDGRLTV